MSIKRRDFLKVAVTGGAAAALPAPAEARPNLEVPDNAIGMLYDATLCIGCKACMVGCKEANGMPVENADQSPIWDTPTDTSGKTLNIIKLYRDGTAEVKDRET
ncbi:MAG: twin-arginine translocation signal domain-containing protein, partial [Xanthomonadales bacterium]|nr:twin-arginine translocation signal domain-containing protein [Xanthomonadales bacterium]